MTIWYLVLTIVFSPGGNEQQMRFEFQSEVSCRMAARALSEKVLVGMKGLPPSRLDYGVSECKNDKQT